MAAIPQNSEGIELFPIQESILEQMIADQQVTVDQQTAQAFQEVSGSEILNNGCYGHLWSSNIHVSSMMSDEQLVTEIGAEVQQTIENYSTPINLNETIFAPTFEIASNPTIPLEEIKARRFNLVDGGKYIEPISPTAYLFDNIENRFNLIDFD